MNRLNAQQLRDLEESKAQGEYKVVKRNPIYFILENVYDTYNIGGLFRLADALAIEKMYICGDTEIPPNHRIKKASIGTYKVVPWEYSKSVTTVVERLRSSYRKDDVRISKNDTSSYTDKPDNELKIIAVEQNNNSINYQKANYSLPVALIFGNESYGITEETLKLADQIVEIPMWGINKSLNVIVSAAIVSYWAINKVSNSTKY